MLLLPKHTGVSQMVVERFNSDSLQSCRLWLEAAGFSCVVGIGWVRGENMEDCAAIQFYKGKWHAWY